MQVCFKKVLAYEIVDLVIKLLEKLMLSEVIGNHRRD